MAVAKMVLAMVCAMILAMVIMGVTMLMLMLMLMLMSVSMSMSMVVTGAVTARGMGVGRRIRRGASRLRPRRISQPFQQRGHLGGGRLRLCLDGQALQGDIDGDAGDAGQTLHRCLDFQRAGGAIHAFDAIAPGGGGRIHGFTSW